MVSTEPSTQPLPSRTRILVVGGGPAGLATSISLVKHGVNAQDIVVVDKLASTTENTSRAVVIHAATLEVRHSNIYLPPGYLRVTISLLMQLGAQTISYRWGTKMEHSKFKIVQDGQYSVSTSPLLRVTPSFLSFWVYPSQSPNTRLRSM